MQRATVKMAMSIAPPLASLMLAVAYSMSAGYQ
jgi:hypothetical protein